MEKTILLFLMVVTISLTMDAQTVRYGPFSGTGSANSATGFQALYSNQSGSNNTANPFSSDTEIKMASPETTRQANLIIYNMEGKELKSIQVNERSNAVVEIPEMIWCGHLSICFNRGWEGCEYETSYPDKITQPKVSCPWQAHNVLAVGS